MRRLLTLTRPKLGDPSAGNLSKRGRMKVSIKAYETWKNEAIAIYGEPKDNSETSNRLSYDEKPCSALSWRDHRKRNRCRRL
jgi:hypothetical protein